MLKAASDTLGLGPGDALHLAERLYLNGFTTYPRTETSKYAPGFDFAAVLDALAASGSGGGGGGGGGGFQGSKPCASTLMLLRVMRAPRAQRLVLLRLFCYCYRYGYCNVMRQKPPVFFGVVILSPAEQGIRSPVSRAVFLTQHETFHRRADHRLQYFQAGF